MIKENKKPVLYMRVQHEFYGLLKSALQFYSKMVGDLEADGFKMNPYDICIINTKVD